MQNVFRTLFYLQISVVFAMQGRKRPEDYRGGYRGGRGGGGGGGGYGGGGGGGYRGDRGGGGKQNDCRDFALSPSILLICRLHCLSH